MISISNIISKSLITSIRVRRFISNHNSRFLFKFISLIKINIPSINLLKKYLFFLVFHLFLFIFNTNPINGDDILKNKNINLSVEDFYPKDISKNIYRLSLKTKKLEDIQESLFTSKTSRIYFELNGSKLEYIKDSILVEEKGDGKFNILVKNKEKIESGNAILSVHLKNSDKSTNQISNKTVLIPDRFSTPGKQPFIQKLLPEAGKIGDTLSLLGENFGQDLDSIFVSIYSEDLGEDGLPIEIQEIRPFYLSSGANPNQQEIKLNLQGRKLSQDLILFKKSYLLSVRVHGRNGDFKKIVILSPYWKFWMFGTTVLLLMSIHIFIAKILNKKSYISMLLLDKSTNTYSLSRFQAFSWTILLLGGYFYITISTGLLLGNGIIPDFNPSLIGLLSISYGGLITAHSLGTKKPKNEIIKTPPLASNLFSSGDTIDLPRLQLFCFTILGIVIYVYNLINSNPLNGLPDIPATFLGLLGVSQTGYITGKFVSDKIAINQIKPYYLPINNDPSRLHILGAGFVPNMKVLLEDSEEPIQVEFINSNAISFIFPSCSNPGMQKLTFLHNDFAPVVTENCFEVFSISPDNIMSYENSPITLTSGNIPPGTELELLGTEENYRIRGNLLPGNKIEFRSPNLSPGDYDIVVHFKGENGFEKIKYNKKIEVKVKEPPQTQSIIKLEELGTELEDEDLPDKTEMPWYMDNLEDDEHLTETQSAIELETEMEGNLHNE